MELGAGAEKIPFAPDVAPFVPLVALEVSVLKLLKMELAGACALVAPNLNPVEVAGLFVAEFAPKRFIAFFAPGSLSFWESSRPLLFFCTGVSPGVVAPKRPFGGS